MASAKHAKNGIPLVSKPAEGTGFIGEETPLAGHSGVLFVEPAAPEEVKKPEDGNFVRGVKKALYQIPETVGGTIGLVGDAVGADGVREYGMGIYDQNHKKVEALTRDSDSLSNVLEGKGNVGDFLAAGTGYVAGQAATALATGGVGGFIGSQLAKRGIREVVARGAESAIAKGVAGKVAATGAKVGAGVALGASNFIQEAGSIYPEAIEQAGKDGRLQPDGTLAGGDLARVVGSAGAAAAVDTAADALMFKGVAGGGRRVIQNDAGELVNEGILQAGKREIPKAMAREAGTEGIQTVIERFGAQQNLTTADAIRDYVDSMGLGALGGGLGGAAASVSRQAIPTLDPNNGPLSRAANETPALTYNPDPIIVFPDGSAGRRAEFDAYIASLPEEKRLTERARLLGLGPQETSPQEKQDQAYAAEHSASQENIRRFSERRHAEPLEEVYKKLQTPGAKAAKLAIVPHAYQDGFTLLPTAMLSIEDQVAADDYAKQAAEAIKARDAEQKQAGKNAEAAAPDAAQEAGAARVQAEQNYLDKERARRDSETTAADGRALSADRKAALEKRFAILDAVLADDTVQGSANKQAKYLAELRRAGYAKQEIRPEEQRHIERHDAIASAFAHDAEPSAPNEMDVAALIPEKKSVQLSTNNGQAPRVDKLPANLVDAATKAKTPKEFYDAAKAAGHQVTDPAVRAPLMEAFKAFKRNKTAAGMSQPDALAIEQAANEAATSKANDLPQPTQAQKDAGNYKKGHVTLHGLDISIENPAGSERSGVSKSGKPWKNKLKHHYGYIKGTVGADKDHIDTFLGPNPKSDKVFVVDQVHPETGKFDEHKVMLGFDSQEEADAAYHANYEKGWKGAKHITETSVGEFKAWLKDGDTKQEFKPAPLDRIRGNPAEAVNTNTDLDGSADYYGTADNPLRFVSGMSAPKDYAALFDANQNVGISMLELSKPSIPKLAKAMADSDGHLFVDSGAFSIFMANVRAKEAYAKDPIKFGNVPPVDRALDFDELIARYEEIARAIGHADDRGWTNDRIFFGMPDIVGDQAGSLALVKKYADFINGAGTSRRIVPLQGGKLTLTQAYEHMMRNLGLDPASDISPIIGIPSQAEAVANDEVQALLEAHGDKISGVHILGAASESRLTPRLDAIKAAGYDGPVSADANSLRSLLYKMARGDAMELVRQGGSEKSFDARRTDKESEYKKDSYGAEFGKLTKPAQDLLDARNHLIELNTEAERQGLVVDDRLLQRIKRQKKLIAELEQETAGGEKAGTALANATAPEHIQGVDDRELGQIVKEFNAAQADMIEGDHPVTNIFAEPTKAEIVRLADKAKVYHKDHGWMTVEQAKEKIAEWKAHAAAQGEDPAIRSANSQKVVLSLFDLTGKWSQPWEEAGYQVYRFDIQDDPEVGDVNNFSTDFFGDWFGDFEGMDIHAVLAACPCTDFAVSGARHFAAKDADGRTVASVKLVHQTLRVVEYFKPAVWAIENPVGRIEKLGGLPPWRLSFDPNHLGDPYTKKTLLWGRFNADLPVAPVEPTEGSKMHRLYGGKSMATKNARSETPEGFSYGFFMANNAHDHAAMALANKFDRLDRGLIEQAMAAGVTADAIENAVEDFYYQDMDDDAANAAIRDLLPPPPKKKPKALAERDAKIAAKKQIPDMTDEELLSLKDFYAPDHARAPKIAKAIRERGLDANEPKPAPVDQAPAPTREEDQRDALSGELLEARNRLIELNSEAQAQGRVADDRLLERIRRQKNLIAELEKAIAGTESKPATGLPKNTVPVDNAEALRGALQEGHIAILPDGRRISMAQEGASWNYHYADSDAPNTWSAGARPFVPGSSNVQSKDGAIDRAVKKYADAFQAEGKQEAPGTRINGAVERAAADRLSSLLDKMPAVLKPRAQSARQHVKSVVEELRREKTVTSIVPMLETASERFLQDGHAPFADVIDQVIDTLQPQAAQEDKPNPAESDQDRSHREWRENYDRVSNTDDLSTVSTTDLERANAFADRIRSTELRKGWDGGKVNQNLTDALKSEQDRLDAELKKRRAPAADEATSAIDRAKRRLRDAKNAGDTAKAEATEKEIRTLRQQAIAKMDDPQPAPAPTLKDETAKAQAQADLMAGLADLADIFGKNAKANITPEQEQRLIPVLTRIMDAAFRLQYYKFKDAARFVLNTIRDKIGPDVAAQVSLDHLQGSYIAMAGKYQGKGADAAKVVINEFDSLSQLEAANGEPNASPVQPESVSGGRDPSPEQDGTAGDRNSQPLDAGMAGTDPRSDRNEGVPAGAGKPDGAGSQQSGGRGQSDAPGTSRNPGNVRDGSSAADDFAITDDIGVGQGGLVKKYNDNIAAIRVIRALDAEGRQATADERKALAKYVGWGGLKGVFDPLNRQWDKQHAELKALLTEDEFAAARKSMRNAHYTSPTVVGAMFKALGRFGFTGGRVLEPSVGVGNFFGLMPKDTRAKSELHGVELDRLTSKIVANLYPKANIAQATGFQDFQIPSGYFDLVIGNPPFGREPIQDGQGTSYSGFSIHNYFFAKSIDKLRPGGILAMVVTNKLMDRIDPEIRTWMANRAELVAGVRLPNTAFKENANTNVVTDILFFRRTDDTQLATGKRADWLDTVTGEFTSKTGETVKLEVNKYFAEHPENVLGKEAATGTQYAANEYTVEPNGDLAEQLAAFVDRLPEGIYAPIERKASDLDAADHAIPDGVKVGSFFVGPDGKVRQRGADSLGHKRAVEWIIPTTTREGVKVEIKTAMPRMTGLIGLRDLMKQQMRLERSPEATDRQIENHRKTLAAAYDAFVKQFGYVNDQSNRRMFFDDTEFQLVQALEFDYDKGIGAAKAEEYGIEPTKASAKKADILQRRVLFPPMDVVNVQTAKDALLASLNAKGRVDMEYMREAYPGKSEQDILAELGDVVFTDPAGAVVMADEYLSGDVKTKLAEAEAGAAKNPQLQRNVEALRAVIPADKTPSEIFAPPGATWIDGAHYAEFARQLGYDGAAFHYVKATAQWLHSFTGRADYAKSQSEFGTSKIEAIQLLMLLMNGRAPEIKKPHPTERGRYVTDEEATEAARAKSDKIKSLWDQWLWTDDARAQDLSKRYNDRHNRLVERKYDGEHLTFPGMSPAITLLEHQKNAVWRAMQDRTILLDHVVGAGKTFEMTAMAMEFRRLGISRKPFFAVPNHLTLQWASEFARLYPASNVLAATPEDFSKENRKKLFAKIATGDWDAVIVGHSSLKKVGLPEEYEAKFMAEQIEELADAIEELKRGRGDRNIVRDMEQIKANLEAKLKKKQESIGTRDDLLTFAELGLDSMFVDEMHEFKNLFFTTQKQKVSGLGNPAGSAKAFDLFMKVMWLRDTMGDKAPTVTATGTPVSNSLSEMYTMQRYHQYRDMKRDGLHLFDAWAKQYGEDEFVYEVAPSGVGYRISQRFSKFKNLPALMGRYKSFADIITLDDLKAQETAKGKRFPVPKIKGGRPNNVVVDRSKLQTDYFGVPELAKAEDGQPLFELHLDKEPEIRQDKEGKWSSNVLSGLFETREELELEMVRRATTPRSTLDPNSLLGKFANLKQLMKESKGRINALSLTGLASKAGLDYRLIDPAAPDHPGSKINRAVSNIVTEYQAWNADKGTQIVFCDLSIPLSARAAMAKNEKRLYVRDDKGAVTSKRGTLHTIEGLENFPYYLVKPNKKPVALYDPVTGRLLKDGFENKAAANEFVRNLLASDKGQEQWMALRESQPAITDDELAEYKDANDIEDDADAEISAADLDGVSSASRFSVYDDMKDKLVKAGIPAAQIEFIHDHNTPTAKQALFKRVKAGQVRILFGSTPKLGAGTNVQDRLVALHHVDAPWRPSDLEQREGRIVRRGNLLYERDPDGFEVGLYRYATEQTYDTRRWQLLEHKAAGIEQLRKYDGANEIEDVTSEAANSADMKAAASGNPLILKETQLRTEKKRLETLERADKDERYALQSRIRSFRHYIAESGPRRIAEYEGLIKQREASTAKGEYLSILGNGEKPYADREKALAPFAAVLKDAMEKEKHTARVTFKGLRFTFERGLMNLAMTDPTDSVTYIGADNISPSGILTRMNNFAAGMEGEIERIRRTMEGYEREIAKFSERLTVPFQEADALERVKDQHGKVQRALMKASASDAIQPADRPVVEAAIAKNKERLRALGLGNAVEEMEAQDRKDDLLAKAELDGATNGVQSSTPEFDLALGKDIAAGATADDLLAKIETQSVNPDYRELAAKLRSLGLKTRMELGSAKDHTFAVKGNGYKYQAGFDPNQDRAVLFQLSRAEANILHELVHAATFKALRKNGLAAQQMKALYRHVKQLGTLNGTYGMENLDEFVAESFTNAQFQSVLRDLDQMPTGSRFKNAWDKFVAIVLQALGLPVNRATLLDQVLRAGQGVMEENQRITYVPKRTLDGQGAGKALGNAERRTPADYVDRYAKLAWQPQTDDMMAADLGNGWQATLYHGDGQAELSVMDPDGNEFGKAVRYADMPTAMAAAPGLLAQRVTAEGRRAGDADMLGSAGGPISPQRRKLLAAALAAMAAPGAMAAGTPDVALGKARAIDPAILREKVSPAVAKILIGNGATNPAGEEALAQAMDLIAKSGPTELRALAATIKKLLPKTGVYLTVDQKRRMNAHGAVEFQYGNMMMTLFTAGDHTGLSYATVLHEALHVVVGARYQSLSVGMIRNNDKILGLPTPGAAPELQQFRDLWSEFKDATRGEKFSDDKLSLAVSEARSDPDEFFVRSLTDPTFQKYLAGKQYQGKTLLQRFKDWVKSSLFGIKQTGTLPSWLDAALIGSEELLSGMTRDPGDLKRYRAIAAHLDSKRESAPEAKFSRSTRSQSTGDRIGDLLRGAGVSEAISNNIADRFQSERTFNSWWHKTVGTQYHKAQIDRHFKRVYDLTQRYLSTVSLLANEAADLAPSLLPKLEGIRDLAKKPAASADTKAVGQAVFAGTLTDKRVYSPAELKAQFKLTGEKKPDGTWTGQIGMYHEFRKAVDQSLDDLGKSHLVRYIGREYAHLAPQIMAAKDINEAADLIIADMEQSMGDDEVMNQVRHKANNIDQLKIEGYAPLSRFGEHTVYVKAGDGSQLYFGMTETAAEAAELARAMREAYPDATVTKGILSKEGHKLFSGISPDTIEAFANAVGVAEDPLFQDYLKLVVNNRSAMKRLIHRKGVPGFSQDTTRVLANFLTSNARAASRNLYGADMSQAAEDIPKEKGDVRDEAIRLVDYVQHPVEEAAAIRGLLFTNFIGGSLASAAVNMTQPLTMTLPYLAQFKGAGNAATVLAGAMKLAALGDAAIKDAGLRDALQNAEREGVVSPQEIHNLQAEAMRTSKGLTIAGKEIVPAFAARKMAVVWGGFFSLAEQFNRKATFIAAYQMAQGMTQAQLQKHGVVSPYAFAVKAIAETQGVYNRGNRPDWARGAIGATLMTFKQYSVAYLEFLTRLPPKERALALAILVVAAGVGGLPFAEDAEDIIDTIAQALGYNWQTKKVKEKFVLELLGEHAGGFVLHGFSGAGGLPLDVSLRMGMGNLLPATGLLKRGNTDKSDDVLEIAGAAGGFAKKLMTGADNLLKGDVGGAYMATAATAIQNVAKAVDMMEHDAYRDGRGRKIMATDGLDAVVKGIGFQPANVADEQRKLGMARESIAVAKSVQSEIADQWAQGIYDKDPAATVEARRRLAEWNERNPDSRISLTTAQIARRVREMRTEKAERLLKTAPKAMRAGLREELE